MNRRDFLRFAAPLAAAGVLAPELLLPCRTFFLPPAGGWQFDPQIQQWINEDMLQAFLAAERACWHQVNPPLLVVNEAFHGLATAAGVPEYMLRVNQKLAEAMLPSLDRNLPRFYALETKRRLA